MEPLRTELILKPSALRLGRKDRFVTMGSCFANALGAKLETFKFATLTNPFGATYNPVSIHRQLKWSAANEMPEAAGYGSDGDLFFHYHFHSQFSSLQKPTLETQIAEAIQRTNTFLKTVTCLTVTYGTAWVYELKNEKEIVANCHKQPSSLFEKRLLTQEEIIQSFTSVYQTIVQQNPSLKIILTVSPVRHLKDTLPANALSKSILRVACYHLTHRFENVEYFPAYEIMVDDLRDYRFYRQDRIHPTEEAEDYIWEKFCQSHFDKPTLEFLESWKEIQSALAHKPFHQSSKKHQDFLRGLLVKLENLKPFVDVEKEISELKKKFTGSFF